MFTPADTARATLHYGGRSPVWVALRTPCQLCNCLGPAKTETLATARFRTTDRGKTKSSQALVFLAPASSSPSRDQANIQVVCGAVTAQPWENRLARPIRSPPSSRRARVARWSQVIHRYPPLLESWRGNPLTVARPVQSPWSSEWMGRRLHLLPLENCVNGEINFPCFDSSSIKHTH
jgi:hypothetical protein